jgi:hypothetical protein
MASITDPSSATSHRSAGLLMLVLLAGCAAIVIAGHGSAGTAREPRSVAAWHFASWSHSAAASAIGGRSVAEGRLEPRVTGRIARNGRARSHFASGFSFAPGAPTLSRRLNLPPPAC